jgi:hypothetical protein
MDGNGGYPLQVGETVEYDGYRAGTLGTIVDRVSADYLRVLWRDTSVPTTHRSHSLKRVAQREYRTGSA